MGLWDVLAVESIVLNTACHASFDVSEICVVSLSIS